MEKAEPVLCVQAAPAGVERRSEESGEFEVTLYGRWRRLQRHHELVIYGTVHTAAVGDADGHRARARADASGVGRPSADTGDQEGEHLDRFGVERDVAVDQRRGSNVGSFLTRCRMTTPCFLTGKVRKRTELQATRFARCAFQTCMVVS